MWFNSALAQQPERKKNVQVLRKTHKVQGTGNWENKSFGFNTGENIGNAKS